MPILLLLEDEPLIALDVEFSLGDAGFLVSTVVSCMDALAWLDANRPDLVIVDIILRDGPCHAVVERLVADGIPFIVHSGDHPDMHADTVLAHGSWIAKPANSDAMIRAARDLLVA